MVAGLSAVGITLWVILTLVPLVIVGQQLRRAQNKLPYSWQPLQGEKYRAAPGLQPTLYLPLLLQFVLFGGLLAALGINYWGDLDYYRGGQMGLVNFMSYQSGIGGSSSLTPMQCSLTYYQGTYSYYYYYYSNYSITGPDCFVVVGGSIMVFIMSLFALGLSIYQMATMQPWIRWGQAVAPAGQDNTHAAVPGLWVRNYIFLVLHVVMVLIYGLVCCLFGSVIPSTSYWILLAVTVLARLQYYLVEAYIKALPPPNGCIVGYPQCTPAVIGALAAPVAVWAEASRPQNANPAALEMGFISAPPVPPLAPMQPQLSQNPYLAYGSPAYAQWAAAQAAAAAAARSYPVAGAPVSYNPYGPQVNMHLAASPARLPEVEGARYPAQPAPASAPIAVGAPVAAMSALAAVRTCPGCRSNERSDATFCSACGTRL